MGFSSSSPDVGDNVDCLVGHVAVGVSASLISTAMPSPLAPVLCCHDSEWQCLSCFPREPKNETAIAICRRMVQAATDRNALIVWVKVKGHSGDEGNDAADKRANWAQNGGVEHEQDVTRMMDYIREHG